VALRLGNGLSAPLVRAEVRLGAGFSNPRRRWLRCQFFVGRLAAKRSRAVDRESGQIAGFTQAAAHDRVIQRPLAANGAVLAPGMACRCCSQSEVVLNQLLPPAPARPLPCSAGRSAMAMVSGGGSALRPWRRVLERALPWPRTPATRRRSTGLAVAVGLALQLGSLGLKGNQWPNDPVCRREQSWRVAARFALRSGAHPLSLWWDWGSIGRNRVHRELITTLAKRLGGRMQTSAVEALSARQSSVPWTGRRASAWRSDGVVIEAPSTGLHLPRRSLRIRGEPSGRGT